MNPESVTQNPVWPESPPREYGGFHPDTVRVAKSALHYLDKAFPPSHGVGRDGRTGESDALGEMPFETKTEEPE